jgi:hypothetical protein
MGGIMALVLGIGVITTILVGRTKHDLLQTQRQREMSESVRTAALLSHNVLQLQRVLASVTEVLDEATLKDPAALKEFMRTKPVMRNFFANIYVATPDGEVRIMVDETGVVAHAEHRRPRLLRPHGDRGRPMVSTALRGSLTGEPDHCLHPAGAQRQGRLRA